MGGKVTRKLVRCIIIHVEHNQYKHIHNKTIQDSHAEKVGKRARGMGRRESR